MYPNFGTPKIINFPFGMNGKLMIVGGPILKDITGKVLFSFLQKYTSL